ncbi:MAG: glycosyltransferase family 2 protein [Sphingobium sp.]|nr:glycosyltransferase family 2 protein [Sphingobium sp.]
MSVKLSIIIPYFNERKYLPQTLESLGQQDCRDFCLILVDNASSDGSVDIARAVMARYPDIAVYYLHNPVPGQLPTLEQGLAAAQSPYVASCDADTIYPSHYVRQCISLFENGGGHSPAVVGVMAVDLYAPLESEKSQSRIRKIMRKSRWFGSQCHAGGYAHCYRTDVVRRVGGFESRDWPYLLYDHEVYERVRDHGVIRYHPNHYCFPSDRRGDRSAVSWTWGERMVYRFTPAFGKKWFFYQFLAKRFARRGLVQVKLRERNF